jgi:hypothetical protein
LAFWQRLVRQFWRLGGHGPKRLSFKFLSSLCSSPTCLATPSRQSYNPRPKFQGAFTRIISSNIYSSISFPLVARGQLTDELNR